MQEDVLFLLIATEVRCPDECGHGPHIDWMDGLSLYAPFAFKNKIKSYIKKFIIIKINPNT